MSTGYKATKIMLADADKRRIERLMLMSGGTASSVVRQAIALAHAQAIERLAERGQPSP